MSQDSQYFDGFYLSSLSPSSIGDETEFSPQIEHPEAVISASKEVEKTLKEKILVKPGTGEPKPITKKKTIFVYYFDENGKIVHNSEKLESDLLYSLKTPLQTNKDYLSRRRKCLKCERIVEINKFFDCYCESNYHHECSCGCGRFVAYNTISNHEEKKKI